jgi:hypothetical protein
LQNIKSNFNMQEQANTNVSISTQDCCPFNFICPITQELMNHPVMNRWGANYERKAILEWLNKGNKTCPLTRNRLKPSMLIPNAALEAQIREWMLQTGQEQPEVQRGGKHQDFLGLMQVAKKDKKGHSKKRRARMALAA